MMGILIDLRTKIQMLQSVYELGDEEEWTDSIEGFPTDLLFIGNPGLHEPDNGN